MRPTCRPYPVYRLALPALLATALMGSVHTDTSAAPQTDRKPETCRPGSPVDPAAAVKRALDVMGVSGRGGGVLHLRAAASGLAREQSDRWYPPYLRAMYDREYWVDAATGNERVDYSLAWPVGEPPRSRVLETGSAVYRLRDTMLVKSAAQTHGSVTRLLDPWAVLRDWNRDPEVRYAEECRYRDYWRLVLARGNGDDGERLYLDPKSGYPVKLEYDEDHYLWGQQHVEYLYSSWVTPAGGGGAYPGAAFRLEDGETVQAQTVSGGSLRWVKRSDAPSLVEPPASAVVEAQAPPFDLNALPDTVRVSAHTFLLTNRIYTETVTLQGDTVYLLDATSGETRARADSAWIATLFRGSHPVTVVVTDVAWPHIAGLRFWVARGARVVTHEASGPFLRQVTARRWTRKPDALERSSAPRGDDMTLTTVSDSLGLAGGAVRLYPIDGVASEGALMAWVPGDGYLWASDFVQTVSEPSEYAIEVREATSRVGITPTRFAAEHMKLTPWTTLLEVTSR